MSVDQEAVWAIVGDDLPVFKQAVMEILVGMQGR